mmetsp:Transcript_22616/g.52807  ORF Transcript_22616/g.52807 Transcript_22616/m.52807 type:complete len:238 (-) Transcript_22616:192-905(-)
MQAKRRHDLLQQVSKVASIAEQCAKGDDDNDQQWHPRTAWAYDQCPLRSEVSLTRDLARAGTGPHCVDAEPIEDEEQHSGPDIASAVHAIGDAEEARGAEVRHHVHDEGKVSHRLLALFRAPARSRPRLGSCLPCGAPQARAGCGEGYVLTCNGSDGSSACQAPSSVWHRAVVGQFLNNNIGIHPGPAHVHSLLQQPLVLLGDDAGIATLAVRHLRLCAFRLVDHAAVGADGENGQA